jgi:uncharacterized protein
MNAIRLILLILLAWILWRFAQRWYQNARKNMNRASKDEKPTIKPPTATNGVMVRCDYCGLYLPEKEALHSANARYCCEAHERAAQQP